jgi:hypothetical protein
MLKSIDAQRGRLYNWAGPGRAEAVVVAVDPKVSLTLSVRSFFPFVFLEHRERLARARVWRETCAKAALLAKRYYW